MISVSVAKTKTVPKNADFTTENLVVRETSIGIAAGDARFWVSLSVVVFKEFE